jgi:hypothetical protein
MLAKWTSNCKELFDKEINVQDATRVLGIRWNSVDDVFYFEGFDLSSIPVISKRQVLSMLARIFDPLGLLTPVVMTGKILFQQLWRLGVNWDDEIPSEEKKKFLQWIRGFEKVRDWSVPRKYFRNGWENNKDDLEVHVFSDASEAAYGAVAYMVQRRTEKREPNLIMSRARVAPLKKVTLPRLELLGCLLASRLLKFVMNTLHIPNASYHCWSDSQVALGWIKGEPNRYKQFVANRVTEIQQLTDPQKWNHVRGKETLQIC